MTYWVEWRGYVRGHDGRIDPQDDTLRAFLSVLTAKFCQHSDLSHPAVISYDGNLELTCVVSASTRGQAVDVARAAFDECLEQVKAISKLPHSDHPSWSAYELEYSTEPTEVRELVGV